MDLTDVDVRYRPITEKMRSDAERLLKRANKDSTAVLVDFGESFRRELINSKNMGTSYTPYTMIRLFADEIGEIEDRLLYLDTDVMLKGNIRELYDKDIGNYHVAGARDFFGKVFFGPRYLNAGVILFNMDKMKGEGVFKLCRRLCNDKKMLLSDQHALNKYAKRKLILRRRFNEQHKNRKDTLIRHFAMTIRWFPYFRTETVKPWQTELIHEKLGDFSFDDIFLEYTRFLNEKEEQRV
jgi:lipopolysaccharide biosynthesis glycosyltransferase